VVRRIGQFLARDGFYFRTTYGGRRFSLCAILRTRILGCIDDGFGSTIRFRCGGRVLRIENGSLGIVREIVDGHC